MGWVWAIMFGHGGSVLARGNWLYLSWAGGFHLNMFSAWERTVVDGSKGSLLPSNWATTL